eukprot:5207849-Amphidinium_carterae.2
MEKAYRQPHAEVQRLVGEQQTQASVITGLQQELHRARAGNTRMVPLKLGQPLVFAGDEATYGNWALKLKTFMGQESITGVQWMREMESAPDALDFDLYVEETKREAVTLYLRLVVLTDKTALGIVKQFGSQDGFEAYRIAAWERHIETHERISGERILDSPNASDWTAMRMNMQSYLLATVSAPKPVRMDLGYLPWSSKGEGKDGKDKGHKRGKGKGDKNCWYNNGGKGGKGKSKDKGGNGKGQ